MTRLTILSHPGPLSRLLFTTAAVFAIALNWSSIAPGVAAGTRYVGDERVVPLESETPIGGELCPWPGFPGYAQTGAAQGSSPPPPPNWPPMDMGVEGSAVRTRAGSFDRAPARYIHDPAPAWAGIAVNAENNMVVAIDENTGRIVEYSRLDNTPPNGPATEPRRVINGLSTHIEMPCAVYLDPETLETRIVNNDTQDWMPIFSREAQGNAKPDRILPTPHQTWGIAMDEVNREMYLTVQGAGAVVVYRKEAVNFEVPKRLLEGDHTRLADPHGVAVDTKSNLLIVANHGSRSVTDGSQGTLRPYDEWKAAWERGVRNSAQGGLNSFVSMFTGRGPSYGRIERSSINIYARTASGNTPPLRVIQGPRTQLNYPATIAVHEGRGEIFVANDSDHSVLVFKVTDNGDVAPTRVIQGPRTLVMNPTGLTLDTRNDELWVANMGNYTLTAFPITADGDVAPLRQIRGGPAGGTFNMVGNPGAVGYDKSREQILVPN